MLERGTAKKAHRLTLLEYLSNPDNKFLNRTHLSTAVLGFSQGSNIYQVFNSEELTEIEDEALQARRKRYTAKLSRVDDAVFLRACSPEGTAADAKLAYQRLEGWSEKQIKELIIDGPMLQVMFNILPPELASRIKDALIARQGELT